MSSPAKWTAATATATEPPTAIPRWIALFKAPTTGAGSPDRTIMIIQKDEKPVSVYLQTAFQ
jgi:hypothetical protein